MGKKTFLMVCCDVLHLRPMVIQFPDKKRDIHNKAFVHHVKNMMHVPQILKDLNES